MCVCVCVCVCLVSTDCQSCKEGEVCTAVSQGNFAQYVLCKGPTASTCTYICNSCTSVSPSLSSTLQRCAIFRMPYLPPPVPRAIAVSHTTLLARATASSPATCRTEAAQTMRSATMRGKMRSVTNCWSLASRPPALMIQVQTILVKFCLVS